MPQSILASIARTSLALVLSLSGTAGWADTYYVCPSGDDTAVGDPQAPWKTILHAVKAAQPGDTVLIRPGTYQEPEIKIEDKIGTPDQPLKLAAETPGTVRLLSTSAYHALSVFRCVGVVIEGLEVTFPSDSKNEYFGIFATDSSHLTIRGCYVHRAGFSGIQVNGSDHVLIEDNTTAFNSQRGPSQGSGISVFLPRHHGTFPDDDAEQPGIIVRRNTSYENVVRLKTPTGGPPTDGNGIIIDYTDNPRNEAPGQTGGYKRPILVENNVCYNNGGRGIHVYYSSRVTVRHNTLHSNNYVLKEHYTWLGDLTFDEAGDCRAFANIVVQDPANSHAVWINAHSPIELRDNLLVGSVAHHDNSVTSGSPPSASNLVLRNADEVGFQQPGIGEAWVNLQLGPQSPAFGRGQHDQAPADNRDGQPRPTDHAPNWGAY